MCIIIFVLVDILFNVQRILRQLLQKSTSTSCIESVKDSETHLQFSVLTGRLRVSSCVSISRVRLRLALWVLQHRGNNRRTDGGCTCKSLRWHNKNPHWFIARRQSCYNGRAAKCFASNQTLNQKKSNKQTKLLKKMSIYFGCRHLGSLITLECRKLYSCTHARWKYMCALFIHSIHF